MRERKREREREREKDRKLVVEKRAADELNENANVTKSE
jgi:hypothetical protein